MTWPSREPSLFGVPMYLSTEDLRVTRTFLRDLWERQLAGLSKKSLAHRSPLDAVGHDALTADLREMKHWFDPVASGSRVREIVFSAPTIGSSQPAYSGFALMAVGEGRGLLTLEGRAILWVLDRSAPSWQDSQDSKTLLSSDDCFFAVAAVQSLYGQWARNKLKSASDLMAAETSSLRPSAAGLLFFLLLNRHTAEERGLPLPANQQMSDVVSDAIAGPVLGFSRALSGSQRASARGVDLYRGWALGEIQRRLGSDLRKSESRVWIEEAAIDRAVDRLAEAISGRVKDSLHLRAVLHETLAEYESSRSRLASAGIANERPSTTARLMDQLTESVELSKRRGAGR